MAGIDDVGKLIKLIRKTFITCDNTGISEEVLMGEGNEWVFSDDSSADSCSESPTPNQRRHSPDIVFPKGKKFKPGMKAKERDEEGKRKEKEEKETKINKFDLKKNESTRKGSKETDRLTERLQHMQNALSKMSTNDRKDRMGEKKGVKKEGMMRDEGGVTNGELVGEGGGEREGGLVEEEGGGERKGSMVEEGRMGRKGGLVGEGGGGKKGDMMGEGGGGRKGGLVGEGGGERKGGLLAMMKEHDKLVKGSPWGKYSGLDALESGGVKTFLIHPTMSSNNHPFPVTMATTDDVNVIDFIGLVCWRYFLLDNQPPLSESHPSKYSLLMADSGGHVDWDLPPLDHHQPISKFSFNHLALVRNPPNAREIKNIDFSEKFKIFPKTAKPF